MRTPPRIIPIDLVESDRRRRRAPGAVLLALAAAAPFAAAQQSATSAPAAPSLDETRVVLGKWIETQQLIAKERKDWQQGKEILAGRLELVQKELSTLTDKIKTATSTVGEADQKLSALRAENATLEAALAQLATSVTAMEADVKKLLVQVPPPVRERLQPLAQRLPEDAQKTKISTAERFQNVLGILNELNKANNELTVAYEVRTLADGKNAEVRALYVGLSQAYYVSAGGEAGIGRPTPEGWKWEPTKAVASEVLAALEIKQGKQTPAFVPLPVRIQ